MSTPELSEHERHTLARIEAAEPAPESLRERVARALHDDDCDCEEWPCLDGWYRKYRRLADAALAVIKGDPS